jgi:hypothetical protein
MMATNAAANLRSILASPNNGSKASGAPVQAATLPPRLMTPGTPVQPPTLPPGTPMTPGTPLTPAPPGMYEEPGIYDGTSTQPQPLSSDIFRLQPLPPSLKGRSFSDISGALLQDIAGGGIERYADARITSLLKDFLKEIYEPLLAFEPYIGKTSTLTKEKLIDAFIHADGQLPMLLKTLGFEDAVNKLVSIFMTYKTKVQQEIETALSQNPAIMPYVQQRYLGKNLPNLFSFLFSTNRLSVRHVAGFYSLFYVLGGLFTPSDIQSMAPKGTLRALKPDEIVISSYFDKPIIRLVYYTLFEYIRGFTGQKNPIPYPKLSLADIPDIHMLALGSKLGGPHTFDIKNLVQGQVDRLRTPTMSGGMKPPATPRQATPAMIFNDIDDIFRVNMTPYFTFSGLGGPRELQDIWLLYANVFILYMLRDNSIMTSVRDILFGSRRLAVPNAEMQRFLNAQRQQNDLGGFSLGAQVQRNLNAQRQRNELAASGAAAAKAKADAAAAAKANADAAAAAKAKADAAAATAATAKTAVETSLKKVQSLMKDLQSSVPLGKRASPANLATLTSIKTELENALKIPNISPTDKSLVNLLIPVRTQLESTFSNKTSAKTAFNYIMTKINPRLPLSKGGARRSTRRRGGPRSCRVSRKSSRKH